MRMEVGLDYSTGMWDWNVGLECGTGTSLTLVSQFLTCWLQPSSASSKAAICYLWAYTYTRLAVFKHLRHCAIYYVYAYTLI